jgi:hypothetical protein
MRPGLILRDAALFFAPFATASQLLGLLGRAWLLRMRG